MNSALPKLRNDLLISQQQAANGVHFVIKDPLTGAFFRFKEVERFITQQCDGETPLEVIRQRTADRFGASLPAETLSAFIRNLSSTGLLDNGQAGKKRSRGSGRIRGNLLYLRFKLFDPDRLFEHLVCWARLCFTPGFVIVAGTLILLALGVALSNANEATQQLASLYHFSALVPVLVAIFVVLVAHEFAHGLTCKFFGGEVHEIGFLLIYFQPAFYCNVSDAWLFPEKSKRLWVAFAGPFFELFIWALAVLAWRVTDEETWLNSLAFIVMMSSGIKTLINFNPLIKLDGYYLLSDYLEIPNLRKRSFQYIGEFLKKLTGPASPAQIVTPRERKIFLLYGLIATVSSFSLIAFVAVKAGGLLIEQQQPIGFFLFAAMLALRLRQRLGRLLTKPKSASRALAAPPPQAPAQPPPLPPPEVERPARALTARTQPRWPSDPHPARFSLFAGRVVVTVSRRCNGLVKSNRSPVLPASPERPADSVVTVEAQPVQSQPVPARPGRRRWWRRPLRWLIYAGMLTGLYFAAQRPVELRIGGGFNVLPQRNADARAQIEGLIEEVLVDEGDEVQEGDIIARLTERDSRAELRKLKAEVEEKCARLKLLQAGTRAEQIALAKTAITKAEDRRKYAHSYLSMEKSLFDNKLNSRKDLEAAEEQSALRERELEEARGNLKMLLAGARPEEIEATEAEIHRLTAQQHYLEEQNLLLTVRSPASGIVVTPSRQLKEFNHQLVRKGDLIARINDLKTMTADIVVSEKDIADVKPGQQVILKVRAYPEIAFAGTVKAIATTAQGELGGAAPSAAVPVLRTGSAGRSILVTTAIDNQALLLKPAMSGQAKICCGQKRVFELVTRRLARLVKVEFWSWW